MREDTSTGGYAWSVIYKQHFLESYNAHRDLTYGGLHLRDPLLCPANFWAPNFYPVNVTQLDALRQATMCLNNN